MSIDDLPQAAVEQFLGTGLYCSEALLKVYNNELHIGLHETALKMATALGAGLGGAKCCCGSLTGVVLVASALKGRSSSSESEHEAFAMATKLHDRFKRRFKATCCRSLTRGVEWGSSEHSSLCATYVRGAAEILNDVLVEHGVVEGRAAIGLGEVHASGAHHRSL